MSDDIIKKRFGRYLILDHLVDGGMAKICRARFLGEQADKVVAIKMVQPQYSQNPAFKQMFMDEIKLTFGLLHPNIVQTYDYGYYNKQLFVAMEYCDGQNLKEYLDRLKKNKYVFPVEISIYIISQICQGLHYAHTYTNKLTGKAANIIHRDISPHNIMMTYDGAVKIIDFGIAKSNTNSESTQAGTIKGKLSYLAPEYLDGQELDHRYDQFAVGNTLWEMLCSRRLFRAPNDLAVLKKIQECKIPAPSSINPNVPKELDEIVLKAMRKDRSKRFENMDQLNRALIKFLYANYPDFNSSDLSYFAKELFKDEIRKDREKLFDFGKIDLTPYISELKKEQRGKTLTKHDVNIEKTLEKSFSTKYEMSKEEKEEVVSHKRKEVEFELDDDIAPVNSTSRERGAPKLENTNNPKSPGRRSSRLVGEDLKIDNSNALNASRAKSELAVQGKGENSGISKTGSKKNSRGSKRKGRRGFQEASNSIPSSIVALVALLAFVYFGMDNLSDIQDLILGSDRTPSSEKIIKNLKSTLSSLESDGKEQVQESDGKKKVTVILDNFDRYNQRLFLNGKEQKVSVLNEVEFRGKEYITLRVESGEKKPFVKVVTNNGRSIRVDVPKMDRMKSVYLYQSSTCELRGTIHFSLYGEKRSILLPIRDNLGIAFPLEGEGRHVANELGNVEFQLQYEKPGRQNSLRQKLYFNYSKNDLNRRIDICEIL